jgi:hypothetical protein
MRSTLNIKADSGVLSTMIGETMRPVPETLSETLEIGAAELGAHGAPHHVEEDENPVFFGCCLNLGEEIGEGPDDDADVLPRLKKRFPVGSAFAELTVASESADIIPPGTRDGRPGSRQTTCDTP